MQDQERSQYSSGVTLLLRPVRSRLLSQLLQGFHSTSHVEAIFLQGQKCNHLPCRRWHAFGSNSEYKPRRSMLSAEQTIRNIAGNLQKLKS